MTGANVPRVNKHNKYEGEIKSGSGMPQGSSALTGGDSSQMILNQPDDSQE